MAGFKAIVLLFTALVATQAQFNSNQISRSGFSGNRPGDSGNRPGFSGNRPGFSGNRPGFSGSRPGFSGNRPGLTPGGRPSSRPGGLSPSRPGSSRGPGTPSPPITFRPTPPRPQTPRPTPPPPPPPEAPPPTTIDSQWNQWGAWSEGPCSATCGGGSRPRTRTRTCRPGRIIYHPKPKHHPKPHHTKPHQTKPHHTKPHRGSFSTFSNTIGRPFNKPSSSSLLGRRGRRDADAFQRGHGHYQPTTPRPPRPCVGPSTESERVPCAQNCCPVDCVLGPFTEGPCDRTCGQGMRTRTRSIVRPAQCGGRQCAGPLTQTLPCNQRPCPIDCQWTPWTEGQCDRTCGQGSRLRTRTQTSVRRPEPPRRHIPKTTYPEPRNPYTDLSPHKSIGKTHFSPPNSPRLGGPPSKNFASFKLGEPGFSIGPGKPGFTSFKTPSHLSPFHSIGKRQAQFGGRECVGPATQVVPCNLRPCPVDCQWGAWNEGQCDRTCGQGNRRRTRSLVVQAQNGGQCSGQPSQTVPCNSGPCPVDCQVSEWTNGTCTAPCGEGTRIDKRSVIQQAQNGGRACPDLEREEVCDTDPNGGVEFFEFMDEPVTGDVCRRAKSRKMINVDFGIIEREKSLKIFCTTTTEKFEPKITATKEVRNYEGNGLESLILTKNLQKEFDSLHGTFTMPSNGTYGIENCGENCHVFCDNTGIDSVQEPDYDYSNVLEDDELDEETRAKVEKGQNDEETIATVSVMFYYTDLFEEETSDVQGHIENLIETANQAYLNSDIPLELAYHCKLKVPYPEEEEQDSRERLQQWKDSQGNDDAQLRQSADMAILLTSTIGRGSDGERPVGGEVDAVAPLRSSGAPFAAGWVEKSREKAFIHEVGHLYGARHDRGEESSARIAENDPDTFEFGFFLDQGDGAQVSTRNAQTNVTRNSYTIMADGEGEFDDAGDGRILYISTPKDLELSPLRGRNVFGSERDDNVRQHMKDRFLLAENGDESIKQCGFQSETSILLYPTTLVTRFIPALFN